MIRETDLDLLASQVCSRRVGELAVASPDFHFCDRCNVRVRSPSSERRPLAERLASSGAYVLWPRSGELVELAERLERLGDSELQDARAHLHLRAFPGDQILDEASQPRWDFVRQAKLEVVPFEIDSEQFSSLPPVIDLVFRVCQRVVAVGFEPVLVLIAHLQHLMPPPATDPQRVLAWLGVGEGGVILLRPDGTPTATTLEEHVRAVLAKRAGA